MNSHGKGSEYERCVSKKLSFWISDGKNDDIFWRTQTSGARQTQRKKLKKDTFGQDGDIQAVHPLGFQFCRIFSLECKNYKDMNLWSLINPTKNFSIYSFWMESVEKAYEVGKFPILVARQNRKPDLFVCDSIFFNYISQNGLAKPKVISIYNFNEVDMYMAIFKFEDILNIPIQNIDFNQLESYQKNESIHTIRST